MRARRHPATTTPLASPLHAIRVAPPAGCGPRSTIRATVDVVDGTAAHPAGFWHDAPPGGAPTELFGDSQLTVAQRAAGWVADASGLTVAHPAHVVRPIDARGVRAAIDAARLQGLRVSIAGTRHAGGDQALQGGTMLLDMRGMHRMHLDEATGLLTIQPGATWADAQRYLDPSGRALLVQQSSDVFSVGGSIATNIHGRDVHLGPLADVVESVRVLLADGREVEASRQRNADLFRHVLGGYGQLGVVTEATIHTTANTQLVRRFRDLDPGPLERQLHELRMDPSLRMLQVRLSTQPSQLFEHGYALSAHATTGTPRPLDQRGPGLADDLARRLLLGAITGGDLGKRLFWQAERAVAAFDAATPVSRNQDMSPPVEFLRVTSPDHHQVLREFFVGERQLDGFLADLRRVVLADHANLVNVTLRWTPRDTTSALPYARADGWAAVLYLDQRPGAPAQAAIDRFTRDATAAAVDHGGSFYLPYRNDGLDPQVVRAAYPDLDDQRAAERRYDPGNLFAGGLESLPG